MAQAEGKALKNRNSHNAPKLLKNLPLPSPIPGFIWTLDMAMIHVSCICPQGSFIVRID